MNLSACATGPSSTPTTAVNVKKVRCTGWKKITYTSVDDSPETVEQVREHDAFGRKKKCWK